MDIQSTNAVSSVAATPAVAAKPAANQETPVTTPATPAVAAQKSSDAAQAEQQLAEVAAQLQKFMSSSDRNLEFSVDKAAGTTVITVRDASNGDVIRQIPNEETLRVMRRLNEESGTLIDLSA